MEKKHGEDRVAQYKNPIIYQPFANPFIVLKQ